MSDRRSFRSCQKWPEIRGITSSLLVPIHPIFGVIQAYRLSSFCSLSNKKSDPLVCSASFAFRGEMWFWMWSIWARLAFLDPGNAGTGVLYWRLPDFWGLIFPALTRPIGSTIKLWDYCSHVSPPPPNDTFSYFSHDPPWCPFSLKWLCRRYWHLYEYLFISLEPFHLPRIPIEEQHTRC
jgi:hypothetical protein